MEGENLQLDRQVDLPHVYSFRHAEHERSEVEDAGDARRDQPVADGLGRPGRSGDDADRDLVPLNDGFELIDVADGQLRHRAAHDSGVGVEHGRNGEAAGHEAAVVRQRMPQVSGADDDHRPVLGQAQRA